MCTHTPARTHLLTTAAEEVMFAGLFFCLFVCEQDYSNDVDNLNESF